ncbi:MAG: 30S ribosome-binding factor RbfA [Phycisphaerae bacterium]|nr:30S ribosome-binding factor RbfA [Phycisphaerae bacterium]
MSSEKPRPPHQSSLAAALEGAERRGGGAPSPRVAQIASLISRVLRERLLRGLNDPRVQGMVSVVGVDLSPDMTFARVRISVLPADRGRLTLSGIVSATRHLEAAVRKATRLRRVPRLSFELDDSMKREAAFMSALKEANAEEHPGSEDQPGSEDPVHEAEPDDNTE